MLSIRYSLILLLVIQFLSFIQIRAETPEGAADVILVSEINPPYIYTNEKGEFIGSSVSKVASIFNQAGVSFEIQIAPWKRTLTKLKQQQNVLIFPLSRIAEREKDYKWIVPIHSLNFKIYGRKGTFDSKASDIRSGKFSFICQDKTIFCLALKNLGVPESSIVKSSLIYGKETIEMVYRSRVNFMLVIEETFDDRLAETQYERSQFVMLENYSFKVDEYLASNLDFDDSLIERLRAAAKTLTTD